MATAPLVSFLLDMKLFPLNNLDLCLNSGLSLHIQTGHLLNV
jgi:hypothetical protein